MGGWEVAGWEVENELNIFFIVNIVKSLGITFGNVLIFPHYYFFLTSTFEYPSLEIIPIIRN